MLKITKLLLVFFKIHQAVPPRKDHVKGKYKPKIRDHHLIEAARHYFPAFFVGRCI